MKLNLYKKDKYTLKEIKLLKFYSTRLMYNILKILVLFVLVIISLYFISNFMNLRLEISFILAFILLTLILSLSTGELLLNYEDFQLVNYKIKERLKKES